MTHFEIVSSGLNCKQYISQTVASVIAQKYSNWNLTLIDDGSTDGTSEYFKRIKDPRISCHRFLDNTGAAFRRYNAIHAMSNPNSVVLLLGLDDQLLPNCLRRIAEEYERGMLMTYGNWIDQNGRGLPPSFNLEFDDQTHEERNYRKVTYRSTAPNTFRKFLFDRIPKQDFIVGGKWIDTTTESEVMYSCLEMSGRDRIGLIKEPIYLYNRHKQSAACRLGQQYKNHIHEIIRTRPKKPIYENIELVS